MELTVHELAPAKLNLALSIGPPDVDRMHPIASWMVTVDLFDQLSLTRLPDGSLSRYAILWHKDARRTSDIDWSISNDLAVRSHHALERLVGRALPLQAKLAKRIPVGGGLGGGSSDAAAMLRGVNRLFHLGMSIAELERVGKGLGSDIPFLVAGGSALVEGKGEQLTRQSTVPPLHAVLAFPEAKCPTGAVYSAFDAVPGAILQRDRVWKLMSAGRPAPDEPFNDLAKPAIHVAPSLAEPLAHLEQLTGRPAHVSGSGSTLFVLCDDGTQAAAWAEKMQESTGIASVPVQSIDATEA